MIEDNKLIVGLDLCEEGTQLSVFNCKTFEVDTIYDKEDDQATIPTALVVTLDTKDWLFGREALEYITYHQGELVHSFLHDENARKIYGTLFTREALIEKFVRKVLLLLKREYPNGIIDKIVVTTKVIDETLIKDIKEAFRNLGIHEDRMKIISHQLSYLHFALSQKKELWMNDVGMFEFNEEGLYYHQIKVDRRNKPMIARVVTSSFKEVMSYEMVKVQNPHLPYMFSNLAKQVLYKQIISTIYLTGMGFLESWFEPSLNELCLGRRVFVGNNLFCYGACYAAREMTEERKLHDIALLCDQTMSCSISMAAYWEANLREIVLVEPGVPWYEVNCQFDVILDDETELLFTIRDMMSKEIRKQRVTLEDLPNRQNRTTRLQIRLLCVSPTELILTVKDMGFGEFFSSSNQIWENTLTV